MIASLHGVVQWAEDSDLVLDVNGVGYLVHIPVSANQKPPIVGDSLLLYTYLQVRENDVSLYGFYTYDELEIFKTLLTVPGVGPRTALSVISVFSPTTLRDAIAKGDLAALCKVPGIGRKTAQRMLVDLSNRITVNHLVGLGAGSIEVDEDALNALTALGYSVAEAQHALSQVPKEVTALDERIVTALRNLGTR